MTSALGKLDLVGQLAQHFGESFIADTLSEDALPMVVDTTSLERRVLGKLMVSSESQIVDAVQLCTAHGVSLYPISQGKNWGYGTTNPYTEGALLLDLSRMKGITALDEELATVTVEPGVTQVELYNFLKERRSKLIVPTTGAGPHASILANAIERGYGLAPYADHFSAVLSLRAVLASGEIYRGRLAELGGTQAEGIYRWGVGPYLDGLFSQGNLGIVTQTTIALARAAEESLVVQIGLDSDEALSNLLPVLQDCLFQFGSTNSAIKIFSAGMMLAIQEFDPLSQAMVVGPVSSERLQQLAKKHQIPTWTVMWTVQGSADLITAAKRSLRRSIRRHVTNYRAIRSRTVNRLSGIIAAIPSLQKTTIGKQITLGRSVFDLMNGVPLSIGLKVAYLRNPGRYTPAADLNPAADACGLLWYTPLVPMRKAAVTEYLRFVNDLCYRFQFEPILTLTSVSDRCFDSTLPILFNRSDPAAEYQAHEFWLALFEEGRLHGFVPYRFGANTMASYLAIDSAALRLAKCIQTGLDPGFNIAPGRYVP